MIRAQSLSWAALAAAAVLGTTSCRSIRVESAAREDFRLPAYSTWSFSPAAATPQGPLDLEIRSAIEARMSGLGLAQAAGDPADYELDYSTGVETLRRTMDPYFAMYPVEEYEEGTLRMWLIDSETGEQVWEGIGKSELRVSGVRAGLYDKHITPNDHERDWRVEEKVGEILEELATHITITP